MSDVVLSLLSLFIIDFYSLNMAKASPVSVFLAASSLLLASASTGVVAQAQSSGGLQEWSTDQAVDEESIPCLLYTSPSPRDRQKSRMPSSA